MNSEGSMKVSLVLWVAMVCGGASVATAQPTNYRDHVLPIFRSRCLSCHNSDDRKGDLDLSVYSEILDAAIVEAGAPEESLLVGVLTHDDDPAMPPRQPPIPDEEIAVIRRWIEQGVKESAGSRAIARREAAASKVDWSAVTDAGEPCWPSKWRRDPRRVTSRATTVRALDVAPHTPIVAIGQPDQVLVHRLPDGRFEGWLPFDGDPMVVRFSRDGRFILAGGGRAAESGRVVVWEVESGHEVIAIEAGYDTVLAADLRPDGREIALATAKGAIEIYSTETGERVARIPQHAEWVIDLEYSPDGVLLASADRGGALFLWESVSKQLYQELRGHEAGIAMVDWRLDSNRLLSIDRSGQVFEWNATNGAEVRKTNAHRGGAHAVAFFADGRFSTGGADHKVSLFGTDGKRLRYLDGARDQVTSLATAAKSGWVVAGDWRGDVTVWEHESGAVLARITPLSTPLAIARRNAEIAFERACREEAHGLDRLARARQELERCERERARIEAERVRVEAWAERAHEDWARRARVLEHWTRSQEEMRAIVASLEERRAAAGREAERVRGELARLSGQDRELEVRYAEWEARVVRSTAEISAAEASDPDSEPATLERLREELTHATRERDSALLEWNEVRAMIPRTKEGLARALQDLNAIDAERDAWSKLLGEPGAAERLTAEVEAARVARDAAEAAAEPVRHRVDEWDRAIEAAARAVERCEFAGIGPRVRREEASRAVQMFVAHEANEQRWRGWDALELARADRDDRRAEEAMRLAQVEAAQSEWETAKELSRRQAEERARLEAECAAHRASLEEARARAAAVRGELESQARVEVRWREIEAELRAMLPEGPSGSTTGDSPAIEASRAALAELARSLAARTVELRVAEREAREAIARAEGAVNDGEGALAKVSASLAERPKVEAALANRVDETSAALERYREQVLAPADASVTALELELERLTERVDFLYRCAE